MKKILLTAVTLLMPLIVTSRSQASPQATSVSPASQVQDGTLKDIQGTVKADGDKLKFVIDEDGTVWNVMNPQILKDYVGRHVELNVHLYPSKGSIHVHTVKELKN